MVESIKQVKMDILVLNARDEAKIHQKIINLEMEIDRLKERLDRRRRVRKKKSSKSTSPISSSPPKARSSKRR